MNKRFQQIKSHKEQHLLQRSHLDPKILLYHYIFPEYKSEIVLGNGKFQLDPMSYTVIYEGKEISLAPREFEVLYLLAQRPNWVIPKKNIYCSVWGSNYYDDQIPYKTVEHVVWKIRKKMGHDIIETLINVGYRLKKM